MKLTIDELVELKNKLAAAIRSVQEIVKDLENRRGQLAYDKLAVFLEGIEIIAGLFAEDHGWVYGDTLYITAELNQGLKRSLALLTAAQEKNWWVSICDALEYEIVPIIENWQKIVEQTIASLPPAAPENPAEKSAT